VSEQSGRATMDRPVSDLTGLLVQWGFETGPETTGWAPSWLRANVMGGIKLYGTADNSERSVLESMVGLGRTSGYCIGRHCRSFWKALERCNDARRSSGRAERYACVAAPQRFLSEHPRITPALSGTVRDLPSARAATARCRPHLHRCRRAARTAGDLEWPTVNEDPCSPDRR
jgi:hypothetical protein